jgi:hypothetical protein
MVEAMIQGGEGPGRICVELWPMRGSVAGTILAQQRIDAALQLALFLLAPPQPYVQVGDRRIALAQSEREVDKIVAPTEDPGKQGTMAGRGCLVSVRHERFPGMNGRTLRGGAGCERAPPTDCCVNVNRSRPE